MGVACRRDNPRATSRPAREQMSYPRRQQHLWALTATVYEIAGTALLILGFVAIATGRDAARPPRVPRRLRTDYGVYVRRATRHA